MVSQRQELAQALNNIAAGTGIAARLRNTSANPEVRELAKAVHFIGFGAQEIVQALTDSGYIKDL